MDLGAPPWIACRLQARSVRWGRRDGYPQPSRQPRYRATCCSIVHCPGLITIAFPGSSSSVRYFWGDPDATSGVLRKRFGR